MPVVSIILSSILTSYFDDGLPESVNFFLSNDGLPRLANAACVVSSGFQRLAISISTRLIVCLIPASIRGTAFGVDLFVESALFAQTFINATQRLTKLSFSSTVHQLNSLTTFNVSFSESPSSTLNVIFVQIGSSVMKLFFSKGTYSASYTPEVVRFFL
jgi:hypothetical protein